MAHKLDFTTGKAAFAATQGAWHELGTVVPSFRDVKHAMELGLLDYQVVKIANRHVNPIGTEEVSTESFALYRTDHNVRLAAHVGKGYQVIQNSEAFEIVDALLSEGCKISTAGSINNGSHAFMCIEIPDVIRVNSNDVVKQYALISCGHNGSLTVLAYFTNTRVVCNNTLQLSLKDAVNKISIKHTKSAMDNLKQAGRIMATAIRNKPIVEASYQKMSDTEFTKKQFFDYVNTIFLTPQELGELAKGEKWDDVVSTRKTNLIAPVLDFYESGIGQPTDNTLWKAYNAVTGVKSNQARADYGEKVHDLHFGSDAKLLETAFDLAVNPNKIISLSKKLPYDFNLN